MVITRDITWQECDKCQGSHLTNIWRQSWERGTCCTSFNGIRTNRLPGSWLYTYQWSMECKYLSRELRPSLYTFYQCCLESKHSVPMLQRMFRQWHYVYIVSWYMIGLEQSLKCWQQIIQTRARFSFVFWLHWKYHFTLLSLSPSLAISALLPVGSGLLISAPSVSDNIRNEPLLCFTTSLHYHSLGIVN